MGVCACMWVCMRGGVCVCVWGHVRVHVSAGLL